jgi:hypothetical protein
MLISAKVWGGITKPNIIFDIPKQSTKTPIIIVACVLIILAIIFMIYIIKDTDYSQMYTNLIIIISSIIAITAVLLI